MNTLKIQIPEGFKIGAFNNETGEVTFEALPKDIKERIKLFSDVLRELNIQERVFKGEIASMTPDEAAYKKIKLIAAALNGDWKPDWTNNQWDKWYPWFVMGGSSGSGFAFCVASYQYSCSFASSRLCFKSEEIAEYAGRQFEELYKDYFAFA